MDPAPQSPGNPPPSAGAAAPNLRAPVLVGTEMVAGLVAGIGAGLASAVFLWALDAVTALRWEHRWLLLLLPLAGVLMQRAYRAWGRGAERGSGLILDALQGGSQPVPWTMAPLVLGGTLLSHLCGGSVGREGTAVQMGASLAAVWGRRFRDRLPDPSVVLMAGVAGGFGSVFGTPWAGALYALEWPEPGRVAWRRALPCLIAAWAGHATCVALGVHHTVYPSSAGPTVPAWGALGAYAVGGVAFGLAARAFVACLRAWGRGFGVLRIGPGALPLVSAALLIALTWALGTDAYLGLGVTGRLPGDPSLVRSFEPGGVTAWSWWWKLLFTTLTLAGGFKGGEVTPLFFIGAALGQAVATLGGWPVGEFAALGFIAVFAAASHAPWACVILGWELFGPGLIAPGCVAVAVADAVATGTGLSDRRTRSLIVSWILDRCRSGGRGRPGAEVSGG